ncbi:MAG: hypothetical protein ACK46J_07480 [Burkholderiales bacterium]
MATPQAIAKVIGLANNRGVPSKSDKPSPTPRPVAPINEQIATLELECKYRMVKIRQARHMRDVLQLGMLDIRGEVASHQNEIRGLRQLHIACENRMRELMGSHMLELRGMRDLQRLIQMRSHFQHREWVYLKGTFPLMFREADSEAERIERRLEREAEQQGRRQRGK